MIIAIDDPADPRIDAYRAIRERDLVGREGRFIAEGEVVLRLMLQSGRHRMISALIDAKRIGGLADALEGIDPSIPVYIASQPVLDAIAGFPLHRGILALGQRAELASLPELLSALPEFSLLVALFGISNHDNMGGIFRNAAAFGADAVILDPACCDPLYRKAIRVSVGTSLTMNYTRAAAGEDLIKALETKGFSVIALTPAADETLHRLVPPRRAALLLGAEGPGLPAEILARTRRVRIAMAGAIDSLNVATASGIALHHLSAR